MSERSQLEEITIRGLGIIDNASLDFGPGFTVLTGETGAGKTMILTALSLVLGGKSDGALVRQRADRLIASGSFRVPLQIAEAAIERGVGVDDGLLILTRTITTEGKSRSSAGGVAVPAGVLAELGNDLIEIHAQAANMNITKVSKQREILDRFGGEKLTVAFQGYRESFDSYQQLENRISLLRRSTLGREREIADLQEFADSFAKVKPEIGEFTALEQEIARLSSIEELRTAVEIASEFLSGDDQSVLTLLGQIRKSLDLVQSKDLLIAKIAENMAEGFFLLDDTSHSLHSYLLSLEADPERLEMAQSRKSAIASLLKRYTTVEGTDEQIADLIGRQASVQHSIEDLSGGEDRLALMEEELESLLTDMQGKSAELSTLRAKSASQLSSLVSKEIHSLSMPHTNFICEIISPNYSTVLAANTFTAFGADETLMLLQTHQGGPVLPLSKGASGGEMSRVMLAIEVVLAQSQMVGTYVFDEVDAGVGGKAAIEVGRRLYELSKHAQVIVVTHLPQVAAWADSHFVVRRNDDGSVSQSDVSKVTGTARIDEIARML
ncbi:MAG TPA: DNA repair protein RecN, partial [Candidatus Nanopelagicaceae bacterium]